jgi:hypothetical protein
MNFQSYADPLKRFAKRPETLIIPLYDAKTLFGNLDAIVEASSTFLADIAQIDLSGRVRGKGVGEICLKHVRHIVAIAIAPQNVTGTDTSHPLVQKYTYIPTISRIFGKARRVSTDSAGDDEEAIVRNVCRG